MFIYPLNRNIKNKHYYQHKVTKLMNYSVDINYYFERTYGFFLPFIFHYDYDITHEIPNKIDDLVDNYVKHFQFYGKPLIPCLCHTETTIFDYLLIIKQNAKSLRKHTKSFFKNDIYIVSRGNKKNKHFGLKEFSLKKCDKEMKVSYSNLCGNSDLIKKCKNFFGTKTIVYNYLPIYINLKYVDELMTKNRKVLTKEYIQKILMKHSKRRENRDKNKKINTDYFDNKIMRLNNKEQKKQEEQKEIVKNVFGNKLNKFSKDTIQQETNIKNFFDETQAKQQNIKFTAQNAHLLINMENIQLNKGKEKKNEELNDDILTVKENNHECVEKIDERTKEKYYELDLTKIKHKELNFIENIVGTNFIEDLKYDVYINYPDLFEKIREQNNLNKHLKRITYEYNDFIGDLMKKEILTCADNRNTKYFNTTTLEKIEINKDNCELHIAVFFRLKPSEKLGKTDIYFFSHRMLKEFKQHSIATRLRALKRGIIIDGFIEYYMQKTNKHFVHVNDDMFLNLMSLFINKHKIKINRL